MRSLRVESGILLLVVLTGACGTSESESATDAGVPDSATGGAGATAGRGGASGSSGSGGQSGMSGASGASGTGGRDAGSSGGSGGTGFDPIDTACLSEPQLECLSCCYDNHSPDANPGVAPAITTTRSCACETPGNCRNVCSTTYCVGQPTNGPECYDCVFPTIVAGAACHSAVRTACNGDLACIAYVECRSRCILEAPDAG